MSAAPPARRGKQQHAKRNSRLKGKQTSLDCFMQANPVHKPEPRPPALQEITLSQLSVDELPLCTPQGDVFPLGWDKNPSEPQVDKLMPPTPQAPPNRKSKIDVASTMQDDTTGGITAASPTETASSVRDGQDGTSQEMRPRKLLQGSSIGSIAASRSGAVGETRHSRHGERFVEAARAKASVMSPAPGASSKVAVALGKKRRREDGGIQQAIMMQACTSTHRTEKSVRQICAAPVKKSKAPAAGNANRVDRVGRNPFLPQSSDAELRRRNAVAREVRTNSRFRSEYEEVKPIARSSNAEVCQCRKRFDGALYAVKKVCVQTAARMTRARAEVFALAALSHRNILRYFDSWHEPETGIGYESCLFIVTELCVRPLSPRLGLIPEPPMKERVVRSILHQLLEGLRHVHLARMAHLDIKPANIFISFVNPALANEREEQMLPDGEVVLKLGDFGLATVLEDGPPKDNVGSGGDGRYVCPAVMNHRCRDLRHADIFSLAATVYAMAMGENLRNEDMFRTAIREGKGYEKTHISPSIEQMLLSMLSMEPDSRPSATDLLTQLQAIFESDGHHQGYPVTIRDFDRNVTSESSD